MFGDRVLEWTNYLQERRDGKFAAFDKAIHYTPQMAALLHVTQAWEARGGHSHLDDPVTQPLLNAAKQVRDQLRRTLGSDLTVATDQNPFWHTGNSVKMDSTSVRSHRPWLDVERVAHGAVAGKGRAHAESYDTHVRRMLNDQLFPY